MWAAAAMVLTASVACTQAPRPATNAPRTVRFDVAADPTTLDPLFVHTDAEGVEQQLARLAFEPFYDVDARGRPVPALLTTVPTVSNGGVSRDGRTLTYHLRRGVLWSDGVPVTARDVLFTLHAIVDPRNPVGSREGYDLVDRAVALDRYTVRFHLRRAWAPAVATLFAAGPAPQFVLPAHVLGKAERLDRSPFGSDPSVGDGPFSLVSWRRGDRLTYRANPKYWRGKPSVDLLEVGVVPDPATNLTLLRSGAIDFNLVAPVQLAALSGQPGLNVLDVPIALVAGIALNVRHPPLDDPAVRRALAQSIDRDAISRKITLDHYPTADTDRPRFSWAYDPTIRQPHYDPAAADAALDMRGWRRGANGIRAKGGAPLALTYVQFPETTTGVRVATMVQAELRARGIDATIKSISNAQLFLPAREGGTLARGAFDLAYVPWLFGADPDDRFLYGCAGEKNYMRWCDPRVAALEVRAVSEPRQALRKADYAAIDRIVARDVPLVWLFNPNYVYVYRSRLRGFSPNAFSPTWNAWAWRMDPASGS
ncbi:MAG: peptide ABC transporter substrate-binding protein [Candidatus Baltobacteraceae bacterium]